MVFLVWNETYSVGVKQFDTEHQVLFELVDQIHAAMRQGKGREVVGGILSKLIAYTETHFENEERAMRDSGYPEYAKHKRIHDELAASAKKMLASYKAGNTAMAIEVSEFLQKWLKEHIQGSDRKYGPTVAAYLAKA